jgi:CubicO group peptidase (beta-lactamase class C family)
VEEDGIETTVPEGWPQIGPGHYAAPDGSVELAFAYEEGPTDAFLANWGSPEVVGELQANGLTWTLYEIALPESDAGGFTTISPTDGGFYMVVTLTKANQLVDVRDAVFLPMVQAFTVASEAAVDFSYASPESQGVSAEALRGVTDIVQGYVDDDKIVGAELMVLKNRKVVLHEAFGWRDRGEGVPMERNTLFNIRSMTKPVVGTAIQMLIDEGTLALDDRVAEYLPSFDSELSREITVEHLLTHRSGLPLTTIAASFGEYDSLRELADGAGERRPDFEPGSAFHYSDTAFDVLGALVEVISGRPLQQFVQENILDTLGMADTVMLVEADDPRTDRIAGLYFGAQGEWSRIWSPEEERLYPFAMGSQSLYSTPLDYARFLALWMDEGRVSDQQLLSPEAARCALTPVSDTRLPGAFPGLRLDYGQAWIIYVAEDVPEGKGQMVLFGHNGSDGTWAWGWPDEDLMVLYFTQSRGQGTGIALEDEIDRLLIHPDREEAAVPDELKPYLGTYTALSGPLMYKEFEILVRNGRLVVNLPGDILAELEDRDDEGLWRLTLNPSVALSFMQDENGQVTGLLWHEAGEVFELPRGTAPEEPELDPEAVRKYLGLYERPEEGGTVEVVIRNGHLGVKTPEVAVVLETYAPDEEGKWYFRLNPAVSVSFQEDEEGNVVSLTAHTPEGDFPRPRIE